MIKAKHRQRMLLALSLFFSLLSVFVVITILRKLSFEYEIAK